jgi:phosphoglycolate phosphatase
LKLLSVSKLRAKGIFLDLDGTIVDSREAYYEAARTAFQAMCQKPPKAEAMLEIPRRLELKQYLSDITKSDTRKFLEVYLRTFYAITPEKTRLLPNVSFTLKALSKKAKLALITMRSVIKENMIKELEQFGIAKYFTHIITALDTDRPKPSPDALIECVKAMEAQVCDCIIVGDSISDIKAGKAAGVKTVAVLSGLFSKEELAKEAPDLILKDVNMLPYFIQ